jgi:hypothetical protein
LAVVASLVAAVVAPAAAPPVSSAPATAHVTYVAATSAYVDAGQDEGLAEGDELEVVRDGGVIATLKVTYVSTHRVSCAIVVSTTTLAVGDTVRYTPSAPPVAPAPLATGSTSPASRGAGLHGTVGLGYLGVIDRSGHDGGYSEPATYLRLAGYGLNGSPVDLDVNIRGRRSSYSTFSGGDQTTQRVRTYSASVSYRFNPEERLTVGRQYAPTLDGVEIFDGVQFVHEGTRWGGGILAGLQPDLNDLSFSTDVREYAGYVNVHNLPGAAARWAFATGLVGAYASNVVSREYLFLQAVYDSKWLSMYANQEVDFNRGWKVDVAGLDPVELTGTFVTLRVHAATWLDMNAGYDNRQNVYQYWDYVDPLVIFDRTNRQGSWGGGSFRIGRHVDIGIEGRQIDGGVPGPANSYSLDVAAVRFTRTNFGVRLRGTHFSNLQSNGDIYALSTELTAAAVHLVLSGGRLDEMNVDPGLDRHLTWYTLDLDAPIGRHWYLLLSLERDTGTFEDQDQVYGSVMFRF